MKPENEMSTRRIVIVAPIQMHAYFHTNVPSGGRRAHSTACCCCLYSRGTVLNSLDDTYQKLEHIFMCCCSQPLLFSPWRQKLVKLLRISRLTASFGFFIYLYHILFQRMSRKLCENQIIVHLTMT